MRILLVCDQFPEFGSNFSYYLGREFIKRGHDVHILTSRHRSATEIAPRAPEIGGGLRIHRTFSFHLRVIPYVITPFAPIDLAKIVSELNIDIVNALHLVQFSTFTSFLARGLVKFPLILTVLGTRESFGHPVLNVLGSLFNGSVWRVALMNADYVIADCQKVKDGIMRLGINEEKVFIIPDGVDTHTFNPKIKAEELGSQLRIDQETKIVGYIGSLTYTKGVSDLLIAFSKVKVEFPKSKLLLIGDGLLRDKLERLARNLKIHEDVLFLGYQPRSVVPKWLSTMNCFVLPSYSEGISLALLEAMACGRPIVATRVGGTPELIRDCYNGILVNPGDQVSMAEGIRKMLRDENFARTIGINARGTAECYDWSKVAKRTLDIYEKAIGEHRRSSR